MEEVEVEVRGGGGHGLEVERKVALEVKGGDEFRGGDGGGIRGRSGGGRGSTGK